MQLEASDELASWYGRQAVLRNRLSDPDELEKAQSFDACRYKAGGGNDYEK